MFGHPVKMAFAVEMVECCFASSDRVQQVSGCFVIFFPGEDCAVSHRFWIVSTEQFSQWCESKLS